jgi:hypothetical protein
MVLLIHYLITLYGKESSVVCCFSLCCCSKKQSLTLNKDLLLHTHIVFSNVLCQAPNHDCIVWYFIFIVITIRISRGIPTYPGHVTATSNNRFCTYTSCCGLQWIRTPQYRAKNQSQSLYLDQS